MLRTTIALISDAAYRVDVYGSSDDGLTEKLICYCGPYLYQEAREVAAMFEGVACNRVHKDA